MPKTIKREIKDVWIEYKKTKAESMRNILMENYASISSATTPSGFTSSSPMKWSWTI